MLSQASKQAACGPVSIKAAAPKPCAPACLITRPGWGAPCPCSELQEEVLARANREMLAAAGAEESAAASSAGGSSSGGSSAPPPVPDLAAAADDLRAEVASARAVLQQIKQQQRQQQGGQPAGQP